MTQLLHTLNARLRADFRFAVMSLFGLCAVLAILPFAVYRFAVGDLLAGIVDSVIVLAISAPVIHAWRTGRTHGPAIAQVVVISSAVVVASEVLGRNGMLWAYCVLLANFFLVSPGVALAANVLVVIAIATLGGAFPAGQERVTFAVTATLVSLYAFVFGYRTDLQRRQLEALASHDPLTGAGNRRLLERELEDAVRQFQQRPRPTALAVIDLDHFKRINDLHGHEAGDRVLARFAELVRGHLRKLDRLYRMGGEEFVLLLPSTPPSGLGVVHDKLQQTLRVELRHGDTPVTVSIGAAPLHAGESWSDWLARADAALYRAKHAGRDRCIIDHDPDAHTGSVEVMAERRQRRW